MATQEQESLYSDSVCSSPRSVGVRGNDEEPRVRFMCSYGGRILPRPHDNQLRYVGGDTRIVAVARTVAYSLFISKLSKLCGNNVTVKYQLPNEDLDALISVTTDEDLENMMEEYDRLNRGDGSSRLRLFLFPAKLENASSLGSLLEGSKREHWFLDALNGVPVISRRRSEVSSVASEVPDYLFGLDNIEDWDREERSPKTTNCTQPGPGKSRLNSQQVAEVQSAPGSPVPVSSPSGSTSSAPPSINAHTIAELAAKAEKFAIRPVIADAPGAALETGHRTQDPRMVFEDQTTKLASAEETREEKIVKQETPVETSSLPDVNPDRVTVQSRSPRMKREGSDSSLASNSNLSAHGDEANKTPGRSPDDRNRSFHTDEIYKPAPGVITQQNPQMATDHYVEYTHPAQFVQQAQPSGYWQEDTAGQVYYVSAGAAAPAVMQRQPAYMPLQRMPSTVAYGADVQGVLPVKKMAGTGSVPGSYPVRSPGKAPLYRGPSPRPMAMVAPIMMRPSVVSSDQYGYQQVGYEATNAPTQQIYYTQKPTVMNPQYQPMMAAPVAVDMQTAQDSHTEGSVFGRVSGSV